MSHEECVKKDMKWLSLRELSVGAGKLCCTLKEKGCPTFSLRHGSSSYVKYSLETCSLPEIPLNKAGTAASVKAGESEKGAYLTFSKIDHGSIIVTWSLTKVEGALAFIQAEKPVPEFKMGYAGRRETRNTGDFTKPAYRKAWAAFVKAGKAYGNVLAVYPDAPVKVVLLGNDNSVTKVSPGGSAHINDKNAVAVVHLDCGSFKAQTLSSQTFFDTARSSQTEALEI
jgi:hypothetical protein